jgi:hypothetical protein
MAFHNTLPCIECDLNAKKYDFQYKKFNKAWTKTTWYQVIVTISLGLSGKVDVSI